MPFTRPTVAMVTDVIHPFHRGGKEQRYAEVARRLSADFDVHIHTMNWWRGARTSTHDGITVHALCRVVPLYVKGRRSMWQGVLFALGCLRLLWARFDGLEADHMPYLQLFPLRAITWLRRKRMVVTWHEVWGSTYWRAYLGLPGWFAWFIERAAMAVPDEIIAASRETAARLHEHLGPDAAVTVAPNGVDITTIRGTLRAADAAVDVVAVGRLLPHKRVDLLLDALTILVARGRSVTCTVIGTGPELDRLRQKAQRAGLGDYVEFADGIDDQIELYSLIKAARVFVSASEREGFGIAALEAIACGVPVITTSAPDNLARYLVARADLGVVCEPTSNDLAAAIAAVLDRKVRAAAEDPWLAEYSWESTAATVRRALAGQLRS